jgi:hypothetical protein
VNILDRLVPGAIYVMDRGYVDFERLGRCHEAGSFFVIRAKRNLKAVRRYSRKVDKTTSLVCDQTVTLSGFYSHLGFPRRCAGSASTIRRPASGWSSSPTTSRCRR